jgi:hypothetical protein
LNLSCRLLRILYVQAHAAGSLNAEYLSREGATIRANDSKQIVLRPAHLHFGSIPVGAVVHRTAKLLNGSSDVVRFTIMRPELPLRYAQSCAHMHDWQS